MDETDALHDDVTSEVTTEVTVDAPAGDVWDLLVDDEELSAWLGDGVTLDPVPGGRGTLTDDEGVVRELRVDEVAPGESISWRWWPAGDEGGATSVRIDLLPDADGGRTSIRVTETVGTAGATTTALGRARATVEAAWSDRLLAAELLVLCRLAVFAGVRV